MRSTPKERGLRFCKVFEQSCTWVTSAHTSEPCARFFQVSFYDAKDDKNRSIGGRNKKEPAVCPRGIEIFERPRFLNLGQAFLRRGFQREKDKAPAAAR
ncbi:hypothetical protein DNTS_021882 [Danionella cerebrum]|uniref:Uncharacterized protein n=1 Tax=Danionella cerebrum TaxID=2873325 RepID=A0A553R5F9_9TELE|nr:hypothetical protein DNTS_021882 [Danionella translucida]